MSLPGLLVTRPEPGATDLARWAEAHGFRPVLSPVLHPVRLPAAPDLADIDAVILTSPAAARLAPAAPALRDLPCWCVGEATAEAARAAGFPAPRAGPSDAQALARLILAEAPAGARLLHLRGRHATAGFAEALRAGGLRLREAVIYEMRPAPALTAEAESALAAREIALAPVWSPRSARILAGLLARRFDLSATTALAISPAAAAPLRPAGFGRVAVAPAPTGAAMRDAMRAFRPDPR
ncbi:MAG: uroporphyrinogen-III synthase [Pseudomonadota bacterium]